MIQEIKTRILDFGFDDYKIIEVNSKEHQLYLLKDCVEARRTVESHYYEITVYADHRKDGEKLRGEYTFVFKPSDDLSFYLEQAKSACIMIENRYYGLMESTSISTVEVLDPKLSDPGQIGGQLAETLYNSSKGKHVYLSSSEIYLTKSEVTLTTSTGIEVSKVKGLIEIDVTLISSQANREQELNFQIEARSIDGLRLAQRLSEYKEYARDMLNVQLPKNGKAAVAFRSTDIYDLMDPVIFHSSGRAKDQAISRFQLDESIVEKSVNTFILKSSGILPYGIYSDPFDDDGIPGQEHTIIDHGVFKKYWTTKRYADYLGVEPTGGFKNLVIEPVTNSTFDSQDYYDIVQFSDLTPDPVTGDFVAEIRFGYHVKKGKKTPVKGGSISGNLLEAMQRAYFTNDRVFDGRYLGPKSIVLEDLSVSGQH
ncbi:hypothetical protein AMJ83_05125 [candidate division WOR_3 bacterium SM23_42]|uniref:Metalloprotease TldD/E C-terminal domain-containing protein n=1 Tax=candidate division WOR_3 bacterium SM23_42 TaxID=1703779 RepID=A0A0S8FVC9_UNCW3|nr:MAG: hypothetical protein AMJ83_05125 [candidate division WOR_3 bacterium SM23_42]